MRRSFSPYRTAFRPLVETLEERSLLSFGTNGIVITDVVRNGQDVIYSVALRDDGRIVAAGLGGLAQYQPDGRLDTLFNPGGPLPGTFPIPFPALFYDVAIQPDGKILAAGSTHYESGDFLLRRFHPDGSPDAAFGNGGAVTTHVADDFIQAIALQPDGKIVAVGGIQGLPAGDLWGIARYNPDGSLDTSFDGDGWLTTGFQPGGLSERIGAYAVALQPDGKIVAAGIAPGLAADFSAARYNPDGSLDATFGTGGKVQIDFGPEHGQPSSRDAAYDMALQPDGKILIVGSSFGDGTRFGLARLNPDGTLDAGFAGDGRLIVDTPVGQSGLKPFYGVALQPDGRIVAVGIERSAYVARFHADGSSDTSFGRDGWQYFRYVPAGIDRSVRDVLIQPDGNIVVVGGTYVDETALWAFALARLRPDGSFDDETEPVAHLYAYPDLATVAAGAPLDFYVLALDSSYRLLPTYTGQVAFWATDPQATTPGLYRFRTEDQGIASFPGGLTLRTPGWQVVYVFDTATYSVLGYAVFEVLPGRAAGMDGPALDLFATEALAEAGQLPGTDSYTELFLTTTPPKPDHQKRA